MIVSLTIFILSALGLFAFLVLKAPFVIELDEERRVGKNNIISTAKETIEQRVIKDTKETFESFLQRFLSGTRRVLLRGESVITKWICLLRKKRKKKD